MPRKKNDQPEAVEGEIILSESVSDEAREIRVYDQRGDFLIEVPAGARMTFGYFNPAAAGGPPPGRWGGGGFDGAGSQTMKTTCLRIYADSTDKRQIAAFLGIGGFRDTSLVKLTRLKQRVTIESNFEDDGLGNTQANERAQRALVAAVETETNNSIF